MSEPEQEILDAAVPVVQTSIVEYNEAAAGIAAMQHRLRNRAYNLATVKGDKEARADRKTLVTARTSLDERRKELNEADQERIKVRNAEAKRLTALITELEEPIDQQIKADEQRRAEEKAAAERVEAARVAGLQQRIDAVRQIPVEAAGLGSAAIDRLIAALEEMHVDESFEEFAPVAGMAKDQTLTRLRLLSSVAVGLETAARKAEEQRVELERLQAADRDRKAREEAERQAEQARVAEAQRAESARLAEANAELQRRQDAAAADQRRLDKEASDRRAEEDRQAKAKRDEEDRVAREAREFEARQLQRAREEAAAQRRRQEEAVAEIQRLAEAEKTAALKRLHDAAPRMYDVVVSIASMADGVVPATLHAEARALVNEVGEQPT